MSLKGLNLYVVAGDVGIAVPKWISDERRLDVARLKTTFTKFFDNLQLDDQGLWQRFGQNDSDEDGLPVQLAKKITPFQQVLLFQVNYFCVLMLTNPPNGKQ